MARPRLDDEERRARTVGVRTFLCEKRCAASLQARSGGIRDSLRRGAGQGAVRLLRFATALRVTPLPPLRLKRLVWPKVPFGPGTARMPRFGTWCDAIERYQ